MAQQQSGEDIEQLITQQLAKMQQDYVKTSQDILSKSMFKIPLIIRPHNPIAKVPSFVVGIQTSSHFWKKYTLAQLHDTVELTT